MESKGIKILKILDGVTSLLDLKDYLLLEDTWITEYDKVLYNEKNEEFNVLDFKILEFEKLPNPYIIRTKPIIEKYSCVKLDKPISVGEVLYTHKKTNEIW